MFLSCSYYQPSFVQRSTLVQIIENGLSFLECAAMQFLCRDPFFTEKSYHRNVSLAVNLLMFLFSFYQKANLHLYKWGRLPLLLFTFANNFLTI